MGSLDQADEEQKLQGGVDQAQEAGRDEPYSWAALWNVLTIGGSICLLVLSQILDLTTLQSGFWKIEMPGFVLVIVFFVMAVIGTMVSQRLFTNFNESVVTYRKCYYKLIKREKIFSHNAFRHPMSYVFLYFADPHSRVCLMSPDQEDDPLSSYINANYIRGYDEEEKVYIATQGPTVNTVGDFWKMVWQQHSPIIVMITNIEEVNEKCTEYWPEKQAVYDGIEVTVNQIIQEDDYVLRLMTLKSGGEERRLKHFWYTSWPDQKTPDQAPPLLKLVEDVEEAMQIAGQSNGPIVVHCSAGIGRTGCFIATTILCKQLKNEGAVDILRTTCQLRLDRGGMIQTSEQYQFVHHVLSLFAKHNSHAVEE
ncbi:tyrosine-protein phosphatase non-receptor type 5 [Mixophyes fleayi]|uniref:tyrosine-protein phosphatase non-receptor type 5 n=1 Tax=Mixophyes fleayi TaxID=3061075 RepID=UPI003F4D9E32